MKVRQSSPDSSQICYQAGDLFVDPGIRRVLRGGEDVPLAGLSFDLLVALIRAAPNLVPHERIVQEVWNGQIVSPETLTQRVKLLRDALGDDSQNPRYIAGARGQGYRLIPAVVERPRDDRPGRPRWITAAALLVVAVCLVYVAVWRTRPAGPTETTIRGDSIAILPFENRSANREDAFFADGIHDDLLTRIARMRDLKVIARSSVLGYRDRSVSVPEIARELGVSAILIGAVQRAGDQVRIQVQLIDAARNTQLWAETWDRSLNVENVFAIQTEISRAIAKNLQIALAPAERERLEKPVTSSLAAYDSWARGRQEMDRYTEEGLAAAVTHFQEAVGADPDFALAHAGLAESRLLQARFRFLNKELAVQLAGSSVERALRIDPESAEAFAVKGDVLRMRGDAEGAEAALRQAIALNPNLAAAFVSYGWLLSEQDRTAEQMEMWRRAGILDPRSPVASVHRAFVELRGGRHADAERELRALLERHPDFPPAHVILGEVRAAAGDQAGAIRHYRRALELSSALPLAHAGLVSSLLDLEADADASAAIDRAWRVPETPQLGPKLELVRAMQNGADSSRQREWIAALRGSDPIFAAHNSALLHLREGRFDAARVELETSPGEVPRTMQCTYAFTLMALGEQDRGRAVARSVLQRAESGPDYARRRHVDPVVCSAVLGDSQQALRILEEAAGKGVPSAWRSLLARPELAELRKSPALQPIVASIRAEAARQRMGSGLPFYLSLQPVERPKSPGSLALQVGEKGKREGLTPFTRGRRRSGVSTPARSFRRGRTRGRSRGSGGCRGG
ncbi:MAG TPA: winged helix-turn-helix domain-containing protein [Thermoanaerobaculia bacterium]|nr:winged helix-turn-helix domain-containing protein [Thermoanaerobaculia bacterium]